MGLGWRGHDVRPGLDNRHLIIEGHRRLWKVMEVHGWREKLLVELGVGLGLNKDNDDNDDFPV